MTIEAKTKSPAEAIAEEVSLLQVELPKLTAQRQQLAQFPTMPPDAKPGEIAERIAASVTSSAPKIRGLDAAIANLQNSLASKKAQLAKAQEAERKSAAQQEVDAAVVEMKNCCDRINRASELVEDELQKLQELAAQCGPARWTLHPFQTFTPFLSFDKGLTLPKATGSDTSFYVEPRLANVPL